MKNFIEKSTILYVVLSLIYAPLWAAEVSSSMDLESPAIEHEPITGTMNAHEALLLEVTVTDNAGVRAVTLFYRTQGMTDYRTLTMSPVKGGDNKFAASIPAGEVTGDKLEYFVQAVDVNGNTVARGGKLFPLAIALSGAAAVADSAPVSKAFEDKKKSNYTWAWIVGGIVVGALALSGGGGEDGGDDQPSAKTGSLNIVGPAP